MKPLPNEGIEKYAEVLRVLANTARLKLINTLVTGEYTVAELCEECGLKQSQASQQLKNLYLNKIVEKRREAPRVYYKLKEENINELLKCLRKCERGI